MIIKINEIILLIFKYNIYKDNLNIKCNLFFKITILL